MKQSQRDSFNNHYSHRDSKSSSPSTGRVHKPRDSFGPTLCLIGKNPQSEIQINNDKTYIFMLILEIQRLSRVVTTLMNTQTNSRVHEDTTYLKNQVAELKMNLNKVENQKLEELERQNRVIYSHANAISEYEMKIKIGNRKVSEMEDQISNLHQKIKYLEEDLSRAKVQASKASMNALMNSQSQLQKSMMKQKSAMQMQVWKQKLNKYENMLNQQKQFINSQKFTIDKLQNTQLQIRQKYEYNESMLKKHNQQLLQKVQQLQRQLTNRFQNNELSANRQNSQKMRELQQLRQKLAVQKKQNQLLKNNYEEISKRKNQNSQEMKGVINQLRDTLEDLNNDYIELNAKHDKCKGQIGYLRKQNQNLKIQIQNLQKKQNQQINTLQQQLSNRQVQINRLQKNRKKQKLQGKFQKSYSQAQIRTASSTRHSTTDLKSIIQDVMELQDSNTRINRLIETKSRSQVVQMPYREFMAYSQYGL